MPKAHAGGREVGCLSVRQQAQSVPMDLSQTQAPLSAFLRLGSVNEEHARISSGLSKQP